MFASSGFDPCSPSHVLLWKPVCIPILTLILWLGCIRACQSSLLINTFTATHVIIFVFLPVAERAYLNSRSTSCHLWTRWSGCWRFGFPPRLRWTQDAADETLCKQEWWTVIKHAAMSMSSSSKSRWYNSEDVWPIIWSGSSILHWNRTHQLCLQ